MAKETLYTLVSTGGVYSTYQVTDELYNNVGSSLFQLGTVKRGFLGGADVVIRTGAGGTGNLLLEDTDYVILEEDFRKTELVGQYVYTAIRIDTVAYQTVNLYITYKVYGSYTNPVSLDEVGSIIPYVGSVVPSAQWMFLDGTAISKTTYASLFSRITSSIRGTAGTGACTFADTNDVVTCAGHGFSQGDNIYFSVITTTTGITINTNYFVCHVGTDTFRVATTYVLAMADTETTFATNGTGSIIYAPFGIGSSTTFNIPDLRGTSLVTAGTSVGYTQAEVFTLGTKYNDQFQGFQLGGTGYGGASIVYSQLIDNYVNSSTTPSSGSGAVSFNTTFQGSYWPLTPVDNGTYGAPRKGYTTRGKSIGMRHIIKVI